MKAISHEKLRERTRIRLKGVRPAAIKSLAETKSFEKARTPLVKDIFGKNKKKNYLWISRSFLFLHR